MLTKSFLKNYSGKTNKSLSFPLMLTSLIDAFIIIVIYLLVSFASPQADLKAYDGLHLPQAVKNDPLEPSTAILSINSGHYYINDKEIRPSALFNSLYQLHAQQSGSTLVIQADKKTDYASLSPVILAGSQAGFQQFKFAVTSAEK